MYGYFERRYVAPNIAVVATGHFDWPGLVAAVQERCSGWGGAPVGRRELPDTAGSGGFQVVPRDKVAQEHVMLFGPGPAADAPLRHAADTLALAIGDHVGSRLYWALIDPGRAESADSGVREYQGTGAFMTSFNCEPALAQENLEIVVGVLREVQRDGITDEELHQAKNKITSRLVRAGERPMYRLEAVGMDWTNLRQYRTIDDELAAFDAVTLGSIREVLARYPLDRLTVVALGPLAALERPDGRN
jgi:predicted Zn-dependent peptidase